MPTTRRRIANSFIFMASAALWASLAMVAAAETSQQPDPPTSRSLLTSELLNIQTATRVGLLELGSRLAQATDPAVAQALEAEIARVKAALEIRTLEVRLKFAQADGQDELAAGLAAMLAAGQESAASGPHAAAGADAATGGRR